MNRDNSNSSRSPEPGSCAHKLQLSDLVRESVILSAIEHFRLPPGSRGLDIGCGIGSHSVLLAQAIGSEGHVTGLDRSTQFLEYAKARVAETGLSGRISFREGDMISLPFDDSSFDWVWSVDCAGYVPLDHIQLLRGFMRVVKPGGAVAILAWTSQQLLPGYPRLEARLNATSAGIAPFAPGMNTKRHFLRALGWFREVGLEHVKAKTFVGDISAPLNDDIREFMISLFDMRWGKPKSELSSDDWAEYQRLCTPDSPDFIADLPDYYAFFTYTLFAGEVPE